VSSDTETSFAMNGSAGPIDAADTPRQNSAMYAAPCSSL
jgi:hypothetical protein